MTLPPMARLHPRWPLTDASRALIIPRLSPSTGSRRA
jgi:hypothetical protein